MPEKVIMSVTMSPTGGCDDGAEVAMSAAVTMSTRKVTMSAEKGDHECREGCP